MPEKAFQLFARRKLFFQAFLKTGFKPVPIKMTGDNVLDSNQEKKVVLNPSDLDKIQDLETDKDLEQSSKRYGNLSESEYNDYVREQCYKTFFSH